MKLTLKTLAASAAILATASAVNAQSLSDDLGAAYVTLLQDGFAEGLNENLAVNSGGIDGSVGITLDVGAVLTEESNAGDVAPAVANATSEALAGATAALGDVKTTAVGALNTGVINAGSVSTLVDGTIIDNTDDSSASNTASTAAEAASIASNTTNDITSSIGAIAQVNNTNLAYNNADITGAIDIENGIDVSATSIAATALGAVNDGTISLGEITGN